MPIYHALVEARRRAAKHRFIPRGAAEIKRRLGIRMQPVVYDALVRARNGVRDRTFIPTGKLIIRKVG